MYLRQKLESVGKLVETTEEMKLFINKYGFVTGSSRWGVENNYSDIDIMFLSSSEINFEIAVSRHNALYLHGDEEAKIEHYNTEDFQSCYVLCCGFIHNLLFFYKKESYDKWKKATLAMDELLAKEYISKRDILYKPKRIGIFEILKGEF